MIASTPTYMGPGPPPYNSVQKVLTMATMCTLVMSNNVELCAPMTATPTTLFGTAYTTATNPTCSWICACGTVTITGMDGLPVELMEFDVVDEGDDTPNEEDSDSD